MIPSGFGGRVGQIGDEMRWAGITVAAIGCLALGAHGDGTIDAAGASIRAGAGVPRGTVTSDASAPGAFPPEVPAIAALGSIGTFSAVLPVFAGGGSGAAGPFASAGTESLAGGTYEHSTYTVDAGAVVTYLGSVTIRATGDVSIEGVVQTLAPGATITIRSAGGVTIGGAGVVRAHGSGGSVTIDAARDIAGTAGARVESTAADIDLVTHATGGSSGDVTLPSTDLVASTSGDVRVRAAGSVSASGDSSLHADRGDVYVGAFGGSVSLLGASGASSSGEGDVVVEAAAGVAFDATPGPRDLHAAAGSVFVAAFTGGVTLTGATIEAGPAGDVDVRAAASVRAAQTPRIVAGVNAKVTAYGGDVEFRVAGAIHAVSVAGTATIAASANVIVTGPGLLELATFRLRAIGGDVTLGGGLRFDEVPLLDVRAKDALAVENLFYVSNTGAVALSAGAGGANVGLCDIVSDGAIDVVALGPVTIAEDSSLTAGGALTVASHDGAVDVSRATLKTDRGDATFSPSIALLSFAGDAGAVRAAGATIATGDATSRSGDVRLVVHRSKTPGPAGEATVDAFVLPTKWTTTIDPAVSGRSRLSIKGVIDAGSAPPIDPSLPASFDADNLHIDFPAPVAKGGKLVYRQGEAVLTVARSASGGSRMAFALSRKGPLGGLVALKGEAAIEFRCGDLDASGAVTLKDGRFALADAAGTLVLPGVFPLSVAATVKGAGKDALRLTAGFATSGTPLGIVPDFSISFGDTFTRDIPGGQFTQNGGRFTWKGDAGGVTDVTFDYTTGLVAVKGKGLDLGTFPEGRSNVSIRLGLGESRLTMVLGLTRKGAKLVY